ncbi:MAG: iron ABC transporter substrate-binding protein, partial [Desulfofundulus sp.]
MRTKALKAGFLFIILLVTLVVLGGCGAKTTGQDKVAPQKTVVTDLAGRQVEVPVPARKVVAIGPGALRLVCYVNGADKVVGVENLEKRQPTGRPYILAHPE